MPDDIYVVYIDMTRTIVNFNVCIYLDRDDLRTRCDYILYLSAYKEEVKS